MATTTDDRQPESKATAEALIPQFQFTKILNQDQNGRRITLLGNIKGEQGLLTLERAAFPSEATSVTGLISNLTDTTNLGANDVYRWYMSNASSPTAPTLKVNLIWPCTESHIRKYTAQQLRYVTETPAVYATHIKPWIADTQRTPKRIEWIYNILDDITEQEDVVYRSETFGKYTNADKSDSEGFLLLPDLNWDRRSATGLHLLALVERRDLWSLRGLKKKHVSWLKHLRAEIVRAAAGVATRLQKEGGEAAETDEDQFKCYVHYQPTYYHFHVHVVHVMLEAGGTQAVGKAFSLENLVSQLEAMGGDEEAGLEGVDLTYFVGEESELWKKCFQRLKRGEEVNLHE